MAREVRRRCVLVLLLLLLLSLLCVRAGAGDSADDDCVACRYTFGYSYEFFAGHHVEVRNTPDRRYFPTHGLSYQFWMFPYDVTSGRLQGIVGNLFAKSETLQFYNTGFYLHNDRLLFVSGPLDLSPDANLYPEAKVEARRWVHVTGTVVVTPQTATMVLYINGVRTSEKAVGNITMWPFDPRLSLFVARDEEEQIIPHRYYTGLLDEIRYYAYTLSDEQVAASWDRGVEHPEEDAGLLLYLNADHDSPTGIVNLGSDRASVVRLATSARMAAVSNVQPIVPTCRGCFTGAEPSFCHPMQSGALGRCGDGIVLGNEECDGGDHCRLDCTCEEGYVSHNRLPYCNLSLGKEKCDLEGLSECKRVSGLTTCAEMEEQFVECVLAKGCDGVTMPSTLFVAFERCVALCTANRTSPCHRLFGEWCHRIRDSAACVESDCVWCGTSCETSEARCALECGNGVVQHCEACDDGNLADGDGCSAACAVERGWECPPVRGRAAAGGACWPVCGDGITIAREACDDGNTRAGDGCSAACTVERGWACDNTSEPTTCTPVCGDGLLLDGVEECDDGNVFDGDGCHANCTVEPGYRCRRVGTLSHCTRVDGRVVAIAAGAAAAFCVLQALCIAAVCVRTRRRARKRRSLGSMLSTSTSCAPAAPAFRDSGSACVPYSSLDLAFVVCGRGRDAAARGRCESGRLVFTGSRGSRRKGSKAHGGNDSESNSESDSDSSSSSDNSDSSDNDSDSENSGSGCGSGLLDVDEPETRRVMLRNLSGRTYCWKLFVESSPKYGLDFVPRKGVLGPREETSIDATIVLRCTTEIDTTFVLVRWQGRERADRKYARLGLRAASGVSAKIDPDDVTVLRPVGEGSFGTVFLGVYKSRQVAVKVLKNQGTSTRVAEFRREIELMERLRCPFVAGFVGAVVFPGQLCLVSEFYHLGGVGAIFRTTRQSSLLKLRVCLDAAKGMAYLHSCHIIHRDLKPDNLLAVSLDPLAPVTCVLTDFGSTCEFSELSGASFTRGIGTPYYMAPEVLRHDLGDDILSPTTQTAPAAQATGTTTGSPYTMASDVYSYAVLAWEVFAGVTPYSMLPDTSLMGVVQFVLDGGRMALPSTCRSPAVRAVIEQAWDPDPGRRPSFLDISSRLEPEFVSLARKINPLFSGPAAAPATLGPLH